MTHSAGNWDNAYLAAEAPPWEIGRPQPAFARLAARGLLRGRLLDAGCGTGEHALLAASLGASAHGVDLSPAAIERAREKAATRGLTATFEAGDILTVGLPQQAFDSVVDSGLFHFFDDDGRGRYVDALSAATAPGGTFYLMCFSDEEPGDWGPRRVRRDEIHAAFADGWSVESIEPDTFDIHGMADVPMVHAWLATVRRS